MKTHAVGAIVGEVVGTVVGTVVVYKYDSATFLGSFANPGLDNTGLDDEEKEVDGWPHAFSDKGRPVRIGVVPSNIFFIAFLLLYPLLIDEDSS